MVVFVFWKFYVDVSWLETKEICLDVSMKNFESISLVFIRQIFAVL